MRCNVVTAGIRGLAEGPVLALMLVIGSLFYVALMRGGLLVYATLITTMSLLNGNVLTIDPSAWYFTQSFLRLAALLALGVYGFLLTQRGRPLFGDDLKRVT